MGPSYVPHLQTVLVAQGDTDTRMAVASALRQNGYHVLEAQDRSDVFDVVRTHSRAIHLLVTTDDLGDATWAAQLRPYRPAIKILILSRDEMAAPERVLSRVRRFFETPSSL
jgi:DNA-binding response OmpR family regulator